MNELNWQHDLPQEEGFYWYFLKLSALSKECSPAVLEVKKNKNNNWIYLPFGSGPLNVYYRPNFSTQKLSFFARIPFFPEWKNLSIISGKNNYGWIRHPKRGLGFGILNRGIHDEVYGTWIWNTCGSDHGHYHSFNEGYEFFPVKVPSEIL